MSLSTGKIDGNFEDTKPAAFSDTMKIMTVEGRTNCETMATDRPLSVSSNITDEHGMKTIAIQVCATMSCGVSVKQCLCHVVQCLCHTVSVNVIRFQSYTCQCHTVSVS